MKGPAEATHYDSKRWSRKSNNTEDTEKIPRTTERTNFKTSGPAKAGHYDYLSSTSSPTARINAIALLRVTGPGFAT
jgi:hypothetical protein